MIQKDSLERLYRSYGFDIENSPSNEIAVFTYKKSRYFGVDIIPLTQIPSIIESAKNLSTEFSKCGYAVNLKTINDNDEAELELFKSFFSFNSTRQRLRKKYIDFCKKQTKNLLGFEYKYIQSPFEVYNHSNESLELFEVIDLRLQSDKPELLILEAAAGYGKTCTAYEILNRIAQNFPYQLPIFTELSRNRGANIFRYILLDEIDIEFPSLNSNLVIKEIKNGRIPLIIDGFDELLEKINSETVIDSSFDEVESMLDTIGSLLESKTKIILTTRKTAIFTGLEFETWFNKWQEKFHITRIALKEPRLKDWLGSDKYDIIRNKDIPIQNLSNPVLLTFIKNAEWEYFMLLTEQPNMLVKHYLNKLLEREKDRQNLLMTVENQLLLFRNVAKNLLALDSTVEDKDFFKLIILEDNKKLLEETKNLYSGVNKQTVDSLVDTLCTHALLDRRGRDEGQIGFINDFVFGTFIGDILINCEYELDSVKYSNYMIELAVTAYRVQEKTSKKRLWNKIQSILFRFQTATKFMFDVYLNETLSTNYLEISVYDSSFYNIKFNDYHIESSVFLNCFFKNCFFNPKFLQGVSFINCTFNKCIVIDNDYLDSGNDITSIKCKELNCSILIESLNAKYEAQSQIIVNQFERDILKKLWSISNKKGHHIVKITQAFSKIKPRIIYKAIKSLEERGFLEIKGTHVYFNINKTNLIKQIVE